MRIRPLEKDEAPEPVREVYDELERRTGRVGNFYKMLAHKPELLRSMSPVKWCKRVTRSSSS